MKISTKGRYGLEAVVDLALHASGSHVNLSSISERCGISEAYLLQIFIVLRRAGVVDSIRGAQGGYVLARDPDRITAADVLVALEGPLSPVACITENATKPCDMYENCTTRGLWEQLMNEMTGVAKSVTIKDLMDSCSRMQPADETIEYFI